MVPHLAGAICLGIEWYLDVWVVHPRTKKHERARRCVARKDGEVHSVTADGGSQRKRHSLADAKTRRSGGQAPVWAHAEQRCGGHVCPDIVRQE